MFVPNHVRQMIISLTFAYAAMQLVSYKETMEWIGSSLLLGKAVLKANLEERLLKKKVV